MSNPLFQQFGNQMIGNSELSGFINEIKRLEGTIQNPKAEVEKLMKSGQLSQADFNQFAQIANQISKMM